MMRYSVQPKDKIFVKCYEFLSFAKNMGKNIRKNIIKNLRSKYGQNPHDHTKKSTKETIKIKVIGNQIANKITKISKTSEQNNLETLANENDQRNT